MLSVEACKQIEETLSMALDNKELAGASMMVIKEGEEIYYHQDGYANVEEKKKMDRSSIHRLYSMSKPVTAVAVMVLMERGQIDLFDPVSKYLRGFQDQKVSVDGQLVKVKREMTIKDLLNMTSGLLYPRENTVGLQTAELFEVLDDRLLGDTPMTTLELANKIGQLPLAYQPGESFAYGTSADVLGAVVEAVSKKTFGAFMQEEIFTPLDMNATGFFVEGEQRERLATTYETTMNKELKIYNGNNLGVINDMDRSPAFESGGAGLVSTIDDYAKFATMLINKGTYNGRRILREKTVEFLTTQVLNEEQMVAFHDWYTLLGHSYGNLMRVVNRPDLVGVVACEGEYGWDGWLGCYFANCPKEKITILLMMQKKDAGTTPLTRKLRNIILSDLAG